MHMIHVMIIEPGDKKMTKTQITNQPFMMEQEDKKKTRKNTLKTSKSLFHRNLIK